MAVRQLPYAALFGLDQALEALAERLERGEHPLHVATGHVDGNFGLLAVTSGHVLWVPHGPSESVISWPRASILGIGSSHHDPHDDLRFETANGAWEVQGILPVGAVHDVESALQQAGISAPLAEPPPGPDHTE